MENQPETHNTSCDADCEGHQSKSEQEPTRNTSPSPRSKDEPVTCSSKESAKKPVRSTIKHPSAGKREESTNLQPPKETVSSMHEHEPEPETVIITSNDSWKQSAVDIEEEDFDDTDAYYLSVEELGKDPVSSESTESEDHQYYADNVGHIESAYRPICKLCGKSFQSDKALYGHMRLHSHKSAMKQAEDEDCSSNSSQELSLLSTPYHNLKWKTTRKRGRGKKYPSDSPSEDVMEVGNTDRESANLNSDQDEAKLQTGGNEGNAVAMNVQEVKSSEDQASGIELTIQLKNVPESNVRSLLGHIDEVAGMMSAQAMVSTTLIRNSTQNTIERTSTSQEKEKHPTICNEGPKAKRIKLEHSNDGTGVYVCHICGKSFPTHQGLGGHIVSHNRGKLKLEEGGDQTPKKSKKKTGDSEHRCSKCGTVYQSGQSLGGHMRAHYDPGKDKKSDSSSLSQTVKEENVKETDEPSTANTMHETSQLPIAKEDKDSGRVTSESPLTNTMQETGEAPIVNEDAGRVLSESSSENAPASDIAPAFDLNETPDVDDDYVIL